MPQPSSIDLRINTTADTAGLEQAISGTRRLEEATRTGTATASVAVKGQESLDTATKKTQTTTKNTGQTMMEFGRILQDGVAAGLPGMINNFEGLALRMGLGAGVAGAVTMLAVGFQVLMPLLTATDDKARDAAQAQKELEKSTRKAAIEASEQARNAELAAAAQERLERAIRRANDAYDKQVAASAAVRKAKEEEIRLRQVEGDASAELAMAKVEDSLARGAISPAEAERQKNEIARSSERRRFEAEQARKQVAESEMIAKANAARQEAETLAITQGQVASASEGLLLPKQREEAQKLLEKARAEADKQREELRLARESEKSIYDLPASGMAPLSPEVIEDRKRRVQERIADAQRRTEEADAKAQQQRNLLKRDQQARNATGFDSPEQAQERLLQLDTDMAKRMAEADRLSREAAMSEAGRQREGAAFRMRDEAAGIRSGSADIRRAREEEAARQQKAQENRRAMEAAESNNAEAGQSAGALAAMGRGAGMNAAALSKLEALARQVANGDNSDKVLTALQGMVTAFGNSAKSNAAMAEKMAKIQKELDEANAAILALRSGH